MLFNSIEFAIFLPVAFTIYWLLRNKKIVYQNTFLLIASYIFYGWWDARFLVLIFLSSLVDYSIGIALDNNHDKRKRKSLVAISVIFNIGLLGVFKYYNFFIESFVDAFSLFGMSFDYQRLNIVLPVGISFYTFQTLSYSLDVYGNKIKPTRNIIAFFAYVAFFPQLVAGPIERASNLIPQFLAKRSFDIARATDGMRQILWGLFKKVVIADNAAIYVNDIFSNYQSQDGSTLVLGAVLFAFQIYGDFSGYSDIAIGTARLFGFSLMKNFAFPYFSRDIAEFWRRWHISLSTWFRDYLYIPLGGSRGSTFLKIRNTLIIFLVSGLWHGANWTFVVWGLLNALYFMPLLISKRNRRNLDNVAEGKLLPGIRDLFQMGITFALTTFAWIFFRSDTVQEAFVYCQRIFSESLLSIPTSPPVHYLVILTLFIIFEWIHRDREYGLQIISSSIPKAVRWSIYYIIIITIALYGGAPQEFIYFQF